MNRAEVATLLTKIAAYDRRTIGEADVLAWHEVIGDLPLTACMEAVRGYFRERRDWCMPADIVSRVEEVRAKRMRGAIGHQKLLEVNRTRFDEDDDGRAVITRESDEAFHSERAEVRRRIEEDEWGPAEYNAYRRSGLVLSEFDAHPQPYGYLRASELAPDWKHLAGQP